MVSLSPLPTISSGFSTPFVRSVLKWPSNHPDPSPTIIDYSDSLDSAMQLAPLSITSSSDIEVLSNFVSSALISSAKKVIPSSKSRPFLRQNWSPSLKSTHKVSKQNTETGSLAVDPDILTIP